MADLLFIRDYLNKKAQNDADLAEIDAAAQVPMTEQMVQQQADVDSAFSLAPQAPQAPQGELANPFPEPAPPLTLENDWKSQMVNRLGNQLGSAPQDVEAPMGQPQAAESTEATGATGLELNLGDGQNMSVPAPEMMSVDPNDPMAPINQAVNDRVIDSTQNISRQVQAEEPVNRKLVELAETAKKEFNEVYEAEKAARDKAVLDAAEITKLTRAEMKDLPTRRSVWKNASLGDKIGLAIITMANSWARGRQGAGVDVGFITSMIDKTIGQDVRDQLAQREDNRAMIGKLQGAQQSEQDAVAERAKLELTQALRRIEVVQMEIDAAKGRAGTNVRALQALDKLGAEMTGLKVQAIDAYQQRIAQQNMAMIRATKGRGGTVSGSGGSSGAWSGGSGGSSGTGLSQPGQETATDEDRRKYWPAAFPDVQADPKTGQFNPIVMMANGISMEIDTPDGKKVFKGVPLRASQEGEKRPEVIADGLQAMLKAADTIDQFTTGMVNDLFFEENKRMPTDEERQNYLNQNKKKITERMIVSPQWQQIQNTVLASAAGGLARLSNTDLEVIKSSTIGQAHGFQMLIQLWDDLVVNKGAPTSESMMNMLTLPTNLRASAQEYLLNRIPARSEAYSNKVRIVVNSGGMGRKTLPGEAESQVNKDVATMEAINKDPFAIKPGMDGATELTTRNAKYNMGMPAGADPVKHFQENAKDGKQKFQWFIANGKGVGLSDELISQFTKAAPGEGAAGAVTSTQLNDSWLMYNPVVKESDRAILRKYGIRVPGVISTPGSTQVSTMARYFEELLSPGRVLAQGLKGSARDDLRRQFRESDAFLSNNRKDAEEWLKAQIAKRKAYDEAYEKAYGKKGK